MYRCTYCNNFFEEPFIYYEDPSPPGISLPPGCYKFTLCPYCESDWIEEVSNDEEDWEEDWTEEKENWD